jgi:hypothetical protein
LLKSSGSAGSTQRREAALRFVVDVLVRAYGEHETGVVFFEDDVNRSVGASASQ